MLDETARLMSQDYPGLPILPICADFSRAWHPADRWLPAHSGKRVVFWNTYNSAPYPPALADVDVSALPAEFRHYLR